MQNKIWILTLFLCKKDVKVMKIIATYDEMWYH